MQKIIAYIAGTPRSGSTLVDRILGGMDNIAGLGEVVMTLQQLSDINAVCACRKKFISCPIWSKVLNSFSTDFGAEQSRMKMEVLRFFFEGRGALMRVLNPRFSRKKREDYRQIWGTFWNSLEHAAGNARVMVDSSKSEVDAIWRPLALTRILDRDVRVIHIIRDARGVIYSDMRGSNTLMERNRERQGSIGIMRTCYQWIRINLRVKMLSLLLPEGKYLRIRYEELASHPQEIFYKITEFLSQDTEQVCKHLTSSEVRAGGHQIYGNRMRFQETLQVHPDEEWKTALPWIYRFFGAILKLLS